MKLTSLLLAVAALACLSSCAMQTDLQKAMGQQMQQTAMMGASIGAPVRRSSSGFDSFYKN